MRDECSPELSFFLDVLHMLEDLAVPYMIIGAFAGIVYGVTRVTYAIDMVVSFSDQHIDALAVAYPSPRYCADPIQMRESVAKGLMFNIIDAERGEKADLIPLTPDPSSTFVLVNSFLAHLSTGFLSPFRLTPAQ